MLGDLVVGAVDLVTDAVIHRFTGSDEADGEKDGDDVEGDDTPVE
jgi:hypothetical protein